MNTIDASAPTRIGWRARYNALMVRLETPAIDAVPALAARLAMAAVFFQSGRTKVDGWLTVSESALFLFSEEYRLPLLAPVTAAHLATWAEHLFPLLLVLGLATRLASLSLLGMTLVIQVFVYSAAWPTHLTWAVALSLLVTRGAGRWSLDRCLGVK